MKKRTPATQTKRPSTRDQMTKLHARVWFLEQIEQREAAYRRALAVVHQREAALKDARADMEKAAAAFLDAYLPAESRVSYITPRTVATAGSGNSVVNEVDFR